MKTRKSSIALLRQLRPEPRVGWGIVLGEERLATAMIDLVTVFRLISIDCVRRAVWAL